MIGFPFDSQVTFDEFGTPTYDRAISSAPLRSLINKLFSNGVMPNPGTNLQVVPNGGMTVKVKAGFAIINGCMKLEETDRVLSVEAAGANDRRDTVVLRLDDNVDRRIIDLAIHKGEEGVSPERPTLTRDGGVYEIGLADIFIPKNTSVIGETRITDTRMETPRCGYISSISEFDTTTLYNQIQADLAEFKIKNEADFEMWYDAFKTAMQGYFDTEKQGFQDWFNGLQIILDGDVAGHLQNEIDDLKRNAEQSVHLSSLAEYEALPEYEKRNGKSYYVDTDDNQFAAKNIAYDNSTSGLVATDVQMAVDKVIEFLNGSVKIDSDIVAFSNLAAGAGANTSINFDIPNGYSFSNAMAYCSKSGVLCNVRSLTVTDGTLKVDLRLTNTTTSSQSDNARVRCVFVKTEMLA